MPLAQRNLIEILADIKRLAVEYYQVAGRPLGITGEVAEFEAADKLGLELADARMAGYDGTLKTPSGLERVQVKGRRLIDPGSRRSQRVPDIKLSQPFDSVALVIMDEGYEVVEIWKAPRDAIETRLTAPGSKARNERGSMAVSQFKSIATKVWPI